MSDTWAQCFTLTHFKVSDLNHPLSRVQGRAGSAFLIFRVFWHLDHFAFIRNRRFVPNQFAYFLWVVLCSHYIIVKQVGAHTLAWLSLRHYVTASCTLVVLCIVGQLHDNSSVKIRCGLTWCSEEVKCFINIWVDEQISQMLDTTHKNSEVYKIVSERMKERGYERSVAHKGQET